MRQFLLKMVISKCIPVGVAVEVIKRFDEFVSLAFSTWLQQFLALEKETQNKQNLSKVSTIIDSYEENRRQFLLRKMRTLFLINKIF